MILKLTLIEFGRRRPEVTLVNPDGAADFYPQPDGSTLIHMLDRSTRTVRESTQEIAAMIERERAIALRLAGE